MTAPDYDITTDGVTIWVNRVGAIARFGRAGIDIHTDPATTPRGAITECLFCTHAFTTASDWELFRVKMKELHGIAVPQKFKPKRFRSPSKSGGHR